jgi:uncharacterized paraquat-inducible protein A
MTICPQCRYERKKGDEIISETECPRCGIIYSKWKPSGIQENNEVRKIDKLESSRKVPVEEAKDGRKIISYALTAVLVIIISSLTIPYLSSQFQKRQNDISVGRIKDTANDPRQISSIMMAGMKWICP